MQLTPPSSSDSSPPPTHHCNACFKPLDGETVHALKGAFHWNCFCCMVGCHSLVWYLPNQDCSAPVASQYFTVVTVDGNEKPLCERDYFRRLNLVCDNCGGALRGSYLMAVGKKFHPEHFWCNICKETFGPDDSYYERDGNVYCHYHYSMLFAIKCTGCKSAILKQFVEINNENTDENWHLECYLIEKYWNTRLAMSDVGEPESEIPFDAEHMSTAQYLEAQTALEEKIYRIWAILSAFTESASVCMSNMLLHVSTGSYIECLQMADYFLAHVDVLFSGIDELAVLYHEERHEQLHYEQEAQMLRKKLESVFSFLAHTQATGMRRIGTPQELLSLVTGLAHFLKTLIRVGLMGAFRLDRLSKLDPLAINRFLSQLVTLANKSSSDPLDIKIDSDITVDLCHACNTVCEDKCFRFGNHRWHDTCFVCCQCNMPLRNVSEETSVDPSSLMLYCKLCAAGHTGELRTGVVRITQLQQFSFLLRIALLRLYQLLHMSGVHPTPPKPGQIQPPATPASTFPVAPIPPESRIQLGDIKRTKSTRMSAAQTDSTNRVAKRSTLMETPSPYAAYVSTQADSNVYDQRLYGENRNPMAHPAPDMVPRTMPTAVPRTPSYNDYKAKPIRKGYYFAELGALDHFMVKHVAVLNLQKMLREHFSLEELADLIDDKRVPTLWDKFVTSFKANGGKKVPRSKEATFGVPLEILVDRSGVDSAFGAGPSRVRIPAIIDEMIYAMKQMDMTVEGLFRKNGNIRRLRELCEEIDKNPNGVNLMNETAVQIAALLKKFLREMPDPLLTFRLHKLFVVSQKLESAADRKRVTHLACCLLPKPNRDTMEALFLFMKWVSNFAHLSNDTGTKMDLVNLATVLAPNIMYSKSKDPIKDESLCCIQAVRMLIENQEEFSMVPDDFVPHLQNMSYGEEDRELNARQLLKKFEEVMKISPTTHHGHQPHHQPSSTSTSPPPPGMAISTPSDTGPMMPGMTATQVAALPNITPPNSNPVVKVGASTHGLGVAYQVHPSASAHLDPSLPMYRSSSAPNHTGN